MATVSDECTANTSAIKHLKEETNRFCHLNNIENRFMAYLIDGQQVLHIFDTPHLIKGIRNKHVDADVRFKRKSETECRASWKDIIELYEMDVGDDNFKICNRLTDAQIYKNKMKVTKVKMATQVYSQRVSSVMRALVRLGMLFIWYHIFILNILNIL